MVEREIIVIFTPFQRDRCVQLINTRKKINSFEEMLKKGNGRPINQYDGQQNKLEIDGQYLKGMKICAFSCYVDLKDQKLKWLADEILETTSPQTATVK